MLRLAQAVLAVVLGTGLFKTAVCAWARENVVKHCLRSALLSISIVVHCGLIYDRERSTIARPGACLEGSQGDCATATEQRCAQVSIRHGQ